MKNLKNINVLSYFCIILFFRKLTDTTNQYSNILLYLLSYKSENVVLHTYLTLNKTIKTFINNFNLKSKHIDRLLKYLLCSNVLNEILCFGCVHSNKQVFPFLLLYTYMFITKIKINTFLIID